MSRVAQRPDNRRKYIIYATLAVVAIAVIVAVALANRVPDAATQTAPAPAAIAVGQNAPTFAVSSTGGEFDLATTTKPVFLEVFATWCPHCQHEVPVLDSLYHKYGNEMAFIAVSGAALGMDSETPENQADVLAFAQRFGVQYPIAFDGQLNVAKSYLKDGFPQLVMIDSAKKIHYISSGEVSAADLEKAIKSTISSHS